MSQSSRGRTGLILPLLIIAGGILILLAGVLLLGQRNEPAASAVATPALETPQAVFEEPSYPEVARISLEEAKTAFDNQGAVFLDVRSKGSYDQSHIAGAVSIPLSELQSRLGELDPQQWIITYCT